MILLITLLAFTPFSQAKEIKAKLTLSHQDILEEIAKNLHSQAPQLFNETCHENQGKYRCGELPFGSIISESEKEFTEFQVPSTPFNQGGFNGTIPSTTIHITLSRSQKQGVLINQPLLGIDPPIKTKSQLGNDFLIQLNSNADHLGGTACIYSPGTEVKFKTEKISFVAKKRYWWFTAKVNINVTIVGQKGSFDAARTCFSFVYNPELKNKVVIVSRTKLELINLKHPSLDIDVKTSGSNLLGSLVNSVAGSKIEKAIESGIEKFINKEVKNLEKNDLLSGKWFAKYIDHKIKVVALDKIESSLFKGYTKKAPQSHHQDLRTKLQSRCDKMIERIAKLEKRDAVNSSEQKFCRAMTDIAISSFKKENSSSKKGCYSSYLRISDFDPILKKALKDQYKDCGFHIEMKTTVDQKYALIGQCLIENLQYHSPYSCIKEIKQLTSQGVK